MTEKETIKIALTGHRPNTTEDYNNRSPLNMAGARRLREYLLSHLNEGKRVHAISGMALGWDTIFALVALKLRAQGHDIILECAIPCEDHSKNWPKASQEQWQQIVDEADKVSYVTRAPYMPFLMQIRNQYMVNLCDELIAIWDGRLSGGTHKCVKYAKKEGRKIVKMNPKEFVIEVTGDLLNSDCDVIFHQANCQSTMGSGIAAQIKKKYPEAYEADKEYPLTPQDRLGKYSSAVVFNGNEKIEVVNLYGQLSYGSGLQTNYRALQEALYLYFNNKIEAVGTVQGMKYGVPTNMGCFHAGGDWKVVTKILEDVARQFHIQIYTYTFKE